MSVYFVLYFIVMLVSIILGINYLLKKYEKKGMFQIIISFLSTIYGIYYLVQYNKYIKIQPQTDILFSKLSSLKISFIVTIVLFIIILIITIINIIKNK